jgi:serine/threonine protein kinase
MHKYKLLGRKGEGTFSEVLKAQSIKTGKFMAIKCMKHVFESIEQVNSLREIQVRVCVCDGGPSPVVAFPSPPTHSGR